MNAHSLASMPAICALVLLPASLLAADGLSLPGNLSAEGLLRHAIQADIDGDSHAREALVREAWRREPDCELARWQSGMLRWKGRWLTADEVVELAASDSRLADYRAIRNAMADTADEHRALARWCRNNELPDEEQVHWVKVLELAPNDREAIRALELRWFHGRIRTGEQVEQERQQAAADYRATRDWRPKLIRLRNDIEHGTARDRLRAIAQLRELTDPDAILALETALAARGKSQGHTELNMLLVETMARMSQVAATDVLVRRAVIAAAPQVRSAAIYELKNRPLHTFVPRLIAAAPAAVMTRYQLNLADRGGIVNEHWQLREGSDLANDVVLRVNRGSQFLSISGPRAALSNDAYLPAVKGASVKDRIQTVLEETLELVDLDDPSQWERTWYDYNGWDVPRYRVVQYSSCFPAGTSVNTLAGPRPIERVRIGDRVLAVDQDSGELGYQAVQRTTRRGMTPTVTVNFDGGSLRATPGHPLWIPGKGWQVAKHVEPGDRLLTVGGSVLVESVDESPPAPVFNLVVNHSHSYFVGDERLLVHDNSPLRAGAALVPGLLAEVKPKRH